MSKSFQLRLIYSQSRRTWSWVSEWGGERSAHVRQMKWKKFRRIRFRYEALFTSFWKNEWKKAIRLSNGMEFSDLSERSWVLWVQRESCQDKKKGFKLHIKSYAKVFLSLMHRFYGMNCNLGNVCWNNFFKIALYSWKINVFCAQIMVHNAGLSDISIKLISSLNMCDLSLKEISERWSEWE